MNHKSPQSSVFCAAAKVFEHLSLNPYQGSQYILFECIQACDKLNITGLHCVAIVLNVKYSLQHLRTIPVGISQRMMGLEVWLFSGETCRFSKTTQVFLCSTRKQRYIGILGCSKQDSTDLSNQSMNLVEIEYKYDVPIFSNLVSLSIICLD